MSKHHYTQSTSESNYFQQDEADLKLNKLIYSQRLKINEQALELQE